MLLRLILASALIAGASVPAAEPVVVERGQLRTEDIPPTPPELAERMLQYQNIRGAGFRGWLAGGASILMSTRFGETSQLHRVDFPLGARTQLTFFREPVGSAAIHPFREELIFAKDQGGDEFSQLHHFNLRTGRATRLTDGRFQHQSALYSNSGEAFVFRSNRKTGKDYDLYLAGASTPADWRLILERSGSNSPVDFSPDDKRLLFLTYRSVQDSSLHSLDLATGQVSDITPAEPKASWNAVGFSPEGTGVFIISDSGAEFRRLGLLTIGDASVQWLTAEIPWDVENAALSRDRSLLAFVTNEDGANRLHLLNTRTLKHKPVSGLPPGLIGGMDFSPDGTRLGFGLETAASPSDIHVLDLEDGSLTRWTRSEVGGLDTSGFAPPELIRWPTFDQVGGQPRQISGYLLLPPGPGPHPVLIDIHGGPEAQFQPGFGGFYQFLARELGIAIIAPNVRGSTGYGRTFVGLDNGKLREDSVRDIGALLDWVATRPDLDAKRVAVSGGSYGGYMVYASLVHYGERLRAGVSIVGISNFVTFLENTETYRRDLRRVEYGDERDPEMRAFLQAISPLTNVGRIRTPVLIAHGANDPRVPVSEAEQMRDAIRAAGLPVWYFLAKDEGHGFAKKTNRDAFLEAFALFLQSHLLNPE